MVIENRFQRSNHLEINSATANRAFNLYRILHLDCAAVREAPEWATGQFILSRIEASRLHYRSRNHPRFDLTTRKSMYRPKTLRSLLFVIALTLGPFSHAQDIPAVFDQVAPSVVEIHVEQLVVTGTTDRHATLIASQGSGVLVSSDGQIITVAHLVQSADTITVQTGDGNSIPAKVLASEPAADIALLQLERIPSGLTPATLGNSDEVKIGQQVFMVGAPYGLHPTITVGHISGRHHPRPPYGPMQSNELFQTDAGMHHGSSGSPLFDLNGRVIGIATQVITQGGQYEGLGFAVTVNTAKALLMEQRSLWTGIEYYWLSGGLAQALNLPQSAGLLVQRIASHSPGSKLLLQAGTAPAVVGEDRFILGGDIILSMQGISLAEEHGYERASAALAALKDGEALYFTVLRAGKQLEFRTSISR
jgi:serine protease Do